MSDVIETRWILNVDGCQVEATRLQGRSSTYYVMEDDRGRGVSFSGRQLPLLTAFLTAMQEHPEGTRVFRCRFCENEIYDANADGRWTLTFDNVDHCPQSPLELPRVRQVHVPQVSAP